MCGRYVSPDTAAIERQWQLRRSSGLAQPVRFNVAPTTDVPFLRMEEGELALDVARWGFIPHWWKQAKPPRLCHNARLEEAGGKPMWRDAMRRTRCLVPAIGWYEWRETDKQPFYFHRRDGGLAALAALFSTFVDPETQKTTLTCAVLSTQAQGELSAVHDRMPVALPLGAQEQWLREGTVATAPQEIAYYPVRKLVNGSRAEGPELIEPLAA